MGWIFLRANFLIDIPLLEVSDLEKKYRIKDNIQILIKKRDGYSLYLIDQNSGFIAVGNKITYSIIRELQKETTLNKIVYNLSKIYSNVSVKKIENETKHIIQWLENHKMLSSYYPRGEVI